MTTVRRLTENDALYGWLCHPGDRKSTKVMRLEQSNNLKGQLKWGDCSTEDGLSWNLMQGTTYFDLRPRAGLNIPRIINLSEQMSMIDASPPTPQPGSGKRSGHPENASGKDVSGSNTAMSKQSSVPGSSLVTKAPKKDVLWCSWEAEHGHLVFLQSEPGIYVSVSHSLTLPSPILLIQTLRSQALAR